MKNRESLIEQYTAIRDIISKNIETIRKLLRQSREMTEILGAFHKDSDAESLNNLHGTIKKLYSHIDELNEAISNLIDQTGQLLEEYRSFADKLFEK